MVVGSCALAYHAGPRYTKVLDIRVNPVPENADRVWRALAEIGGEPVAFLGRADLIRASERESPR